MSFTDYPDDDPRAFRRPGLEKAGVDDEWDDTPTTPVDTLPLPPDLLCKHHKRDCFECDADDHCLRHGFTSCTCTRRGERAR